MNATNKPILLFACLLVLAGVALPAQADIILFYGGDFDPNHLNAEALSNERNTDVAQSSIYQNFIVPVGQTWTIDRLWSNDLMNKLTVSAADWEIRSGVSEGNGGTLIASATDVAATQTATGRIGFTFSEFTVQVTGLNEVLGPGTYWMNVTPVGSGGGRSFNTNTFGLNAVGSSIANEQFWNSSTFAVNFTNANNASGSQGDFPDFSDGVAGTLGTSVPEPGTLVLFGSGVLELLAVWGWRRSRQYRHS